MARPLRIEFCGAVYHICSRGNNRNNIFLDDEDRESFLKQLKKIHERFHWICHAYVLMDNHYHLLIETPETNLSRGMQQLNGVYTQKFNKRHNRVGHLFQGRFKSILVDKEKYLLAASRYIVLNPVHAGIVEQPEDFRWSSFRSFIGIEKPANYLATNMLLGLFGCSNKTAIENFRNFVMNGIGEEYPYDSMQSGVILGSEEFRKKLKKKIKVKSEQTEIPRLQRYASRKSLGEIFRNKEMRKKEKDKKIFNAYVKNGYTMKEIADCLGVHYVTVSRAIKRVETRKK